MDKSETTIVTDVTDETDTTDTTVTFVQHKTSLPLAHATVLYLRRVDTEQILVVVSALVTIRIETV